MISDHNEVDWSGYKLFFFRHVGAMAWRGWPSVFQKNGASLVGEIAKWIFAIFWRPSDTRLVPAHLAATPSAKLHSFVLQNPSSVTFAVTAIRQDQPTRLD